MGVHRVVAGVLVRRNRVLLCHRRADRTWYPDTWDLPGGHRESGETAREAMDRECREELGITVTRAECVPVTTGDPDVDLTVFVIDAWHGEPGNLAPEEHDDIGWFDGDACGRLALADPRLHPLLIRALAAS